MRKQELTEESNVTNSIYREVNTGADHHDRDAVRQDQRRAEGVPLKEENFFERLAMKLNESVVHHGQLTQL